MRLTGKKTIRTTPKLLVCRAHALEHLLGRLATHVQKYPLTNELPWQPHPQPSFPESFLPHDPPHRPNLPALQRCSGHHHPHHHHHLHRSHQLEASKEQATAHGVDKRTRSTRRFCLAGLHALSHIHEPSPSPSAAYSNPFCAVLIKHRMQQYILKKSCVGGETPSTSI